MTEAEQRAERIIEILKQCASDEERTTVIYLVGQEFCLHCGGESDGTCYCLRDD